MAKITACGDSLVVTSDLKLTEIETLERYAPKALTLMDEDGKNVAFKVGATCGEGSIGKYGASFGSAAHDGSGKATITMLLATEPEDGADELKEFIEDNVGMSIIALDKVEKQAVEALVGVASDRAKVLEHLTIA